MTRPSGRIVLVGAGHAHLHTVRRCAEVTARGHDLVLVSPGNFWYSGLATGVLAGQYPAYLDRIDPGGWLRAGGGRLVQGRLRDVDLQEKVALLESGASIPFDVLSLNLGSVVPTGRIEEAPTEPMIPVKPVEGLVEVRDRLREWPRGPRRPRDGDRAAGRDARAVPHLVVIGGGPSGCEVALAAEALLRREERWGRIVLVAGGGLLPGLTPGARRSMAGALERRGVEVVDGVAASAIRASRVELADGRALEAEMVVDASGVVPPPVVAELGLPVASDGALVVDEYLRSPHDPRIFGAGDCVAFRGEPLPRVGVHAVRQAPILHHNLLATLEGGDLRAYRPPTRVLLILNLGDGTGLATWGPFHLRGRLAFLVKDRLDRRFLDRHRPEESKG